MMGPVTVAPTETELSAKTGEAAGRRGISTQEMLSRWDDTGVLYGTPGQLHERIAALEEAGVERIYLQWFDLGDYDGMARMLDLVRG
jgi:alkanesulfonate monooxygenase SsuD/methylene tetrahydromethanopterin reductase-like flavin-dependent oxidoreductase (luciferase family)